MGSGPRSRGSPRAHQTMWGLTLLTLLLLVVEKTNSQVYESWNYGRNQLIRDMKDNMVKMNDRFDSMENSLKEIKKEIQYIRNFSNIPLTHEEGLAKLSCPGHFTPINTTLECIHIANTYSTYKEATESCASLGAHLAVPKDMRLLGDFLIERDSHRRTSLSHDIFWIGADNNLRPDMVRWVDGKTVDVPISVYSTEPGGSITRGRTKLCAVLRLDKHGDDESGDNNLTAKPCEEPQRYPYLCEIDSGSRSLRPEFPHFREICRPEDYFHLPTGECIYISPINDSRTYSKAGNFCAAQGATLIHPRNLTFLITVLTDYHASFLEMNSTDLDFEEEYGFWLSNTVTSIDQDWNEMMQQSKKQEHGDSGTDMCTLFRTRPSKIEMYKEIASCSSSQRFLCSLNIHPKAYGMYGPYG